jgi:hypothetical protein
MKVLGFVSAAAVGVIAGAVGGIYVLQHSTLGSETYGGWVGSKLAGSAAADPFTRALIAKGGLLALNRSETIYFTLTKDEHGRPLTQNCAYQLKGGAFPARWWSVTIYAADDFLPQNHDHAQSIDQTRAERDAGGGWTAASRYSGPRPAGRPTGSPPGTRASSA